MNLSSAVSSGFVIHPQPRRLKRSGIAATLFGSEPLKTRAPAVRHTTRRQTPRLAPEADPGDVAYDRTMSVVSGWFCPPLYG